MKIRPLNGRVLVKSADPSEEIEGGIFIPDTAREKPREGEVVAIAEDATEEVAVGDHVIYREHGPAEVKVEGDDFVLLTAEELVAKYQDVDRIPE